MADKYLKDKATKNEKAPDRLARKIIDEVVGKVFDYEQNMSQFISQVSEWGDMFNVRTPAQRNKKAFSNPRLTEFHRAANTLGSMVYRMLTAQDPFFELRPMSLLQYEGQLLRIEATLRAQLRESRYKPNLLVACTGAAGFGTQIVENRREVVGINSFGRRLPVTTFNPRSLLAVAFERGTTDIAEADWISTSDFASDSGLMTLADNSDKLGDHWQKSVLEAAAKDESKSSSFSSMLQGRLNANRYINQDGKMLRKELLVYNGKLDCMNDNVEYCVALVNRKYLVKFYPNKNQHGKRNFRVATWIKDPLGLDPLGLGIGTVAGKLQKSMDANRQRAQDAIAFASYNMFGRLRSAGINDDQMKIRPLQTLDMDERNGLFPILTNPVGAESALKLEEILKQEFMAASGASPTLQAILTDSTATESTLAQNEALRNISVKAEANLAEEFVREHLNICHSDNVQYLKEPINVNTGGFAGRVYPADLKVDVDFDIKTTTDKDYKPQRLTQLKEILALVLSTKSAHPALAAMDPTPIIKALMKGNDINPDDVFPNGNTPNPMALQMMMATRGGAGAMGGGVDSTESVGMSPAEQVISTPLGGVLGSA
jgi:hypothetical protein